LLFSAHSIKTEKYELNVGSAWSFSPVFSSSDLQTSLKRITNQLIFLSALNRRSFSEALIE
jgi:hypothetical protein